LDLRAVTMPSTVATSPSKGDTLPEPCTVEIGTTTTGGGGASQSLLAEALLRGAGTPVVKSAELTLVSVQPSPSRSAAVVLLSADVAPLPSKQLALP